MSRDAGPDGRQRLAQRRLGRTSLALSAMSLGAAPLGGLYRASSQADASDTVGAALDGGISHVDVAPQYGQGLAERRVGASLAAHASRRMTLSTKVGRLLVPSAPEVVAQANWPEALPYATVYDVTPEGIRRSVADSIERMGGKSPDILLLHDPDRYASGAALRRVIAQAHATLAEMRAEGTVTAIGVGVNAPEPCHMALDIGDWDCFLLAGTHSVIRQGDAGLLDRCHRASVSILIGGPYMSGALAGGSTWRYRPIPPDVAEDIHRLDDICRRHDVPRQAAALQFPLRHAAVASVVVGMRSPGEVTQNLEFLRHGIPLEFWRDLVRARLVPESALAEAGGPS
jgi:D-threo-aldose 1-dehydrogenase